MLCYLHAAEFTLLNKDGTALGDKFDVEQPMSLQEPLALLRNSPFLMKVYDVMETLGWEPYQVRTLLRTQYCTLLYTQSRGTSVYISNQREYLRIVHQSTVNQLRTYGLHMGRPYGPIL